MNLGSLKYAISKIVFLPLTVIDFFKAPAPRNYLKQRNKPIEESDYSGFKFRLLRIIAHYYKKRLLNVYEKMAVKPDFQKPYIYVPLHYQPENTTCPNGDVFDDQLLMVQMLSDCLPEDWRIYVKEYPNQFDYKLKGERSRDLTFYKDLAAISKVTICELNTNSFDLIDNSVAIATITGSAGWESLCRGKLCLLYGNAWYEFCNSVYRIKSVEDCRQAIDVLLSQPVVDLEQIKYFAYVFEKHCFEGYVELAWKKQFEISEAENVELLSNYVTSHVTYRLQSS